MSDFEPNIDYKSDCRGCQEKTKPSVIFLNDFSVTDSSLGLNITPDELMMSLLCFLYLLSNFKIITL